MCGREVVYEYPYLRFDRELEVFRLLGQGRTTSEIADELHLNLKTVQAYCAVRKNSLAELLRAAIRWEDATYVK